MVCADDVLKRYGGESCEIRKDHIYPKADGEGIPPLDEEPSRLEYFSPDYLGHQNPSVVLPGMRGC